MASLDLGTCMRLRFRHFKLNPKACLLLWVIFRSGDLYLWLYDSVLVKTWFEPWKDWFFVDDCLHLRTCITNHDSHSLSSDFGLDISNILVIFDWNFSNTFSLVCTGSRGEDVIGSHKINLFIVPEVYITHGSFLELFFTLLNWIFIDICRTFEIRTCFVDVFLLPSNKYQLAPSLERQNGDSDTRIWKWHFCVFRYFLRPPQTKAPYFLNQDEKTLLLVYSLPCSTNLQYVFQIKKFQ